SPASGGARPAETRAPPRWLLTPTTFLVWVTFFCTMAAFYFFVSWTPRLLNAAGLSATAGLAAGGLPNPGGIVRCGGVWGRRAAALAAASAHLPGLGHLLLHHGGVLLLRQLDAAAPERRRPVGYGGTDRRRVAQPRGHRRLRRVCGRGGARRRAPAPHRLAHR